MYIELDNGGQSGTLLLGELQEVRQRCGLPEMRKLYNKQCTLQQCSLTYQSHCQQQLSFKRVDCWAVFDPIFGGEHVMISNSFPPAS